MLGSSGEEPMMITFPGTLTGPPLITFPVKHNAITSCSPKIVSVSLDLWKSEVPVNPTEPTGPFGPFTSFGVPGTPANPRSPGGPAGPRTPGAPIAPGGPTGPAGPG